MKKHGLMILLACALMCVASVSLAQPGGGGGFGGGGFGGGGFGGGGFPGFGGTRTPPGPPAEVPDVVAIPRPSDEEVATINTELQQMIENNTSANKDLLKKYASLVVVNAPRDNSCIRPTPGVRAGRHDAFVETANTGDFDILFHGDSITDWWQNSGKAVFDEYFGDVKTANFAVAGDTTQGLLWGLQNGEGQGHKPKAVMLMIGTNSTGGNTAAEIAEGIGAVILELRKDFPDAKILLLAIFPRGGPNDANRAKIDEVNKIISKLDDQKHVFYMSINDKFLDENGRLIGFGNDNLHPNAEGYKIWAEAVADKLKALAK